MHYVNYTYLRNRYHKNVDTMTSSNDLGETNLTTEKSKVCCPRDPRYPELSTNQIFFRSASIKMTVEGQCPCSLKSIVCLFFFCSPASLFLASYSPSRDWQRLSKYCFYLPLFCVRRQCNLEKQINVMLSLL